MFADVNIGVWRDVEREEVVGSDWMERDTAWKLNTITVVSWKIRCPDSMTADRSMIQRLGIF